MSFLDLPWESVVFGKGSQKLKLLSKGPGKLGKVEQRCDDGILMSIADSNVARMYNRATNEFKHSRSWNVLPAKEEKGRERNKGSPSRNKFTNAQPVHYACLPICSHRSHRPTWPT